MKPFMLAVLFAIALVALPGVTHAAAVNNCVPSSACTVRQQSTGPVTVIASIANGDATQATVTGCAGCSVSVLLAASNGSTDVQVAIAGVGSVNEQATVAGITTLTCTGGAAAMVLLNGALHFC